MTVDTMDPQLVSDFRDLLGLDALEVLSRPRTTQELADIRAALARNDGDPVAAMDCNVDDRTAAFIRSLGIGEPR